MIYHSTPAVVSQMWKISFHGSSSSPMSALGLDFEICCEQIDRTGGCEGRCGGGRFEKISPGSR